MRETDQLRRIAVHLDNIVGELNRMAGGKRIRSNAVDGGNQTQRIGKVPVVPSPGFLAPGVNVLAQQLTSRTPCAAAGRSEQDIV